jgi:formylmethanofuran dehydrogenase subunit E
MNGPAQRFRVLFLGTQKVCDRCGEMVVERYGRVVGDRRACIPCQEALLTGE